MCGQPSVEDLVEKTRMLESRDSVTHFTEIVLERLQEVNSDDAKYELLVDLIDINLDKVNFQAAGDATQALLELAVNTDDDRKKTSAIYFTASRLLLEGAYSKASLYYHRAMLAIEKNNYEDLKADTYASLAFICLKLGDFEEAEKYYLKTLQLDEEIERPDKKYYLFYDYSTLAEVALKRLKDQNKPDEFLEDKFLSNVKIADSLLASGNFERKELSPFIYRSIYFHYLTKAQYELFKGRLNKADSILHNKFLNSDAFAHEHYLPMAKSRVWAQKGEKDAAQKSVELAINRAKATGSSERIMEAYNNKLDVYKELGLEVEHEWLHGVRYFEDSVASAQIAASALISSDLAGLEELLKQKEGDLSDFKGRRKLWVSLGILGLLLSTVFTAIYIKRNNQFKRLKAEFERELRSDSSFKNVIEKHLDGNGNGIEKKRQLVEEHRALELLEGLRVEINQGAHLEKDFSLTKAAKLLNTNTSYLSEVINHQMGKSFTEFLHEERIRSGIQRLQSDESFKAFTVDGIAESLGYRSRNTFSKAFRNVTGQTPSAFIRAIK